MRTRKKSKYKYIDIQHIKALRLVYSHKQHFTLNLFQTQDKQRFIKKIDKQKRERKKKYES